MKKILLLIFCILLTGCDASYQLEYENNVLNENITFSSKNGIENGINFSDIINDYNQSIYLTDYDVDAGDMTDEEILNTYTVYEKSIINNQFILGYSYYESEKYEKSSLIHLLFNDISIDDYNIKLNDINNIFESYDNLDSIIINFKTDKIVKECNSDFVDNNIYSWYIDKNNYNNKSINVSLSDKKIEEYVSDVVNNTDNYINIIIVVIIIFVLIGVVVLYDKIRKSNK